MKPYRVGILFVHGIQGSPKQFDFLIEQIPDDILCCNVILPGHGATIKEFKESTGKEWLRAVTDASHKMSEQCEHIIFVGHSMGCLLGLLTQQKKALFSSMLLLCCPFRLRPTWRYFRNSLSANLTKGKTDDPFVKAAWDANSVSARHTVSYLFCSHPYFELFKTIRYVRNKRLIIPKDTVFCYSELDEIVSKRCIQYTRERFGTKPRVMSGCGHNYFTPAAQAELLGILSVMVKK